MSTTNPCGGQALTDKLNFRSHYMMWLVGTNRKLATYIQAAFEFARVSAW